LLGGRNSKGRGRLKVQQRPCKTTVYIFQLQLLCSLLLNVAATVDHFGEVRSM